MSVPNERMEIAESGVAMEPLIPAPEHAASPRQASGAAQLRYLLAGMRPHQWVKNGFLFAPLVFAHELGDGLLFLKVLGAFFLFSFTASAVYLGNDVLDVENDRLHPVKRNRPIASGKLSLPLASVTAALLAIASLAGGFAIGWRFSAILLTYLLMNVAYSWRLKRIAYLDVCVIAFGFVLRVAAGATAIDVPPSHWIFVCTFALALYLGFGKRKHEILAAQGAGSDAVVTRKALGGYSLPRLDLALATSGALAMAGYLLYTLAPVTTAQFGHLLVLTLPFPAFGIWRFNRLLTRASRASSPTEALITDLPFVINMGAWLAAVLTIVYVMNAQVH